MNVSNKSLVCLSLCGLLHALDAGAQVTPQWSRPLSAYQRTDETTLAWLPAAGGDTIVATDFRGEVVLRRVRPDGSDRYMQVLRPYYLAVPLYGEMLVAIAEDSAGGDTLVLVSEHGSPRAPACNLVRLDADGRRERVSSVRLMSSNDGACLELTVLPDGSVAVLREHALVRLNADGSLRWHQPLTPAVPAGRHRALLLDAQQRLAVAGGDTEPTVRRFDLDGLLVSTHTLLQPPLPGTIGSLDLLADGDIVVTGSMDPAGGATQTGFVLRLGASGAVQPLYTAATDVPFTFSTHDTAGLLYVQGGDATVRAIAAADGQLRWQRPGRDVAALAAGAVLIQDQPSWFATAVSPQNVPLWSTAIAHPADRAQVRADDSGSIHVVADVSITTADCGPAPAVISLAVSDGAIAGNRRICRIELPLELRKLSALPQTGVLVQLGSSEVRSLDGRGAERWRLDAAALGGDEVRSRVLTSALLPDGGAWLLTVRDSPPPWRLTLRRIGADGGTLNRWNVPLPPDYLVTEAAILGESNEAVLLIGQPGKLRWVRFSRPGDLREIRDFGSGMSDAYRYAVSYPARPRRLAGGDIVLAYTWRLANCGFPCPPVATPTRLMRVGPDGAERWSHEQASWYMPFVGLNSDGSTITAARNGPSAPGEIQRIDANGAAGPRQVLDVSISAIAGPAQDRYLLIDNGTHYAMDAAGNLTPTGVTLDAGELGASNAGFLIQPYQGNADAVLIDAQTYAVTAYLDVGGDTSLPPNPYASNWAINDDGSIYAGHQRLSDSVPSSGSRSHVARFAVTGSAAADIVFLDSFD